MTGKSTIANIFFVFTFLLSSCDRIANIQVHVINNLDKPITVLYIDGNHFTDSLETKIITPGDTDIIVTTHSGILGRNEIPRDHLLLTDTFGMFKNIQIKFENLLIKKDFRLSREWSYKGVNKDLGVYTLEIDSTDIQDKFSN
jgi:hypothetical protein